MPPEGVEVVVQESHSAAVGSIPPTPSGVTGRLGPMSAALRLAPCRKLCRWERTAETVRGERAFACRGCGSQWVASEAWTPADHTGEVPEVVQAERRRGRGWQHGQ